MSVFYDCRRGLLGNDPEVRLHLGERAFDFEIGADGASVRENCPHFIAAEQVFEHDGFVCG